MNPYPVIERLGPVVAALLLFLMIVLVMRVKAEPAAQRFSAWEIAIGAAPLDGNELSEAGQQHLRFVSRLRLAALLAGLASVAAGWLDPGLS